MGIAFKVVARRMKLKNPTCFHAGICSICGKKKQKLGSSIRTLGIRNIGKFSFTFKDSCMNCMESVGDKIVQVINSC